MGGKTSRTVHEIVEDSMYIIRQTNHATYQRSRSARDEVHMKLMELRQLKQEMLQSTESDTQRSHVFESFQKTVGKQKQELEEQVDGFPNNKTQEAAKALEKPQETPH
ncbi:unnamed protein product [Peronospora destructor]|uniref:Uncharacterized protein n=1 Tax=Peronospora destructor TaxID=86335 RepID=A0AAV0UL67_9STRA|nr:unnamed protein product [Peronospora destructor]